jgi:(2R)-ethylmalonyl-CoA mutase
MNTSMTINATAAVAAGAVHRRGRRRRARTAQAVRHGAERHHQGIPVARHLRVPAAAVLKLTTDTIASPIPNMPKWNPMNVCSYHLQEAGATPVQELAFALATASPCSTAVKASGQVPDADFPKVVGRISFFVNAGIRFVTEMCKMRAFTELWDEICRERYGVEDEATAASATACRSTRWA